MANETTLTRLREFGAKEFASVNEVTRLRIERLWLNAGSWRDADVARLSKESWAIARSAMHEVAKREAAYQASAIAAQTSQRSTAYVLDSAAIESVIENPLERFAQPAGAIHGSLAKGATLKDAIELGARQAAKIVTLALVEARIAQVTHSWSAGPVTIEKFRRSLGGTACSYCTRVVGSGIKTYSGQPRPIHSACDCGYEPVVIQLSSQEAAANSRTQAVNATRAKATEAVKTRRTDPVARQAHLEKVLTGFNTELDALNARYPDIAALPIDQRRIVRRRIGIAEQRVKNASAALSS